MKIRKLVYLAMLPLLLTACGGKKENSKSRLDPLASQAYLNLLKTEAAKKVQVDSIFYGIHLKMKASDFYEHCNRMYKKGVFAGGYDMQVKVKLAAPFKRPVKLRFYPSFEKPFISKLDCQFGYEHANIFNKADRSNVLMKELIPVLRSWYPGNEFLALPSDNPLKGPMYVKIDSNRKILVSESDNGTEVDVVFEDLKPLN